MRLSTWRRFTLNRSIHAAYGDDYDPTLEGEYVELTGLSGGRYVLVHTVNGDRRLHERSYSNNAASLLLHLRWQGGKPVIETLRNCAASAQCRLR